MDKREGIKGRKPEFCASCSRAMMSYITTVRDFLDKVVEDIDMNTPSSRREQGMLARMRTITESTRGSTDGRKRSIQSSAQPQAFTTSQPTANQSLAKGSDPTEKKVYELNGKDTLEKKETPLEHSHSGFETQSHFETGDRTVQSKVSHHDAQNSKITSSALFQASHTRTSSALLQPSQTRTSSALVQPSHTQPTIRDTHSSEIFSREQLSETPNYHSPVSPNIDHTSNYPLPHSPTIDSSERSIDHLFNKETTVHSSSKEPSVLNGYPSVASNITKMISPEQPQPKALITEPAARNEHHSPLYSDHLAPPVQPQQAPLPIEEPSLPDGPFPTTWVEEMIRVCDIPLIMPASEEHEAYVTMATNNLTAVGCLVLGNSLRLSGTSRTLAVLITDDITEELRNLLASVFHLVQPICSLEPTGSTKLALLEQPELGITYSKLLVWRLTQFDKCVYLSPDTLVIQNCDELFERNELSAVPDIGWPDFFNAGVFVYVPSDATFWNLLSFAETKGSFDGGDQGLLNFYFRSWTLDINKRLPFIFNLMANVSYTYGPAFVRYGSNAKIVHFFGTTKPWNVQFNVRTGQLAPYSGVHPTFSRYVQYWLTIFAQCVLPLFSPDIQKYTTMHGYVNAVDLARIVTGQAESAITFSPPSFRRYLDVPESVEFPAEKVQNTLLRRLSIDQEPSSEEEEEVSEEEKKEEDKEAEALSDFNRMQAWEQGRIDYMGEDSSDKIMKRLDRFIKKGSKFS